MNRILESFLSFIIRAMGNSYNIKYHNENTGGAEKRPLPDAYLLAAWHQQLMGAMVAQKETPLVAMGSRSQDADPAVRFLRGLGHTIVRGSSSKKGKDKGGKQAKDEMIELVRQGMPGAITPDGPKGPVRVVKPGIIDMARKTGAPVVPYIIRANRYWEFNSWDRFHLPKPFARLHVHYGKAIHIPADLEFEDFPHWQERIADAMNQLDEKALQGLNTSGQ